MKNPGIIKYDSLSQHNEIAHFCTTRHGGVSVGNYASFNLGAYAGDTDEAVKQNYKLLANLVGIEPEQFIVPYQTHSNHVLIVNKSFLDCPPDKRHIKLNGVDALVTNQPGICIGVTTADCVPILFYDQKKKVVAAAHAGWRGTCSKIAEVTVTEMRDKFGCQPTDIEAVIGPSISGKVYNVGTEVLGAFSSASFPVELIFSNESGNLLLDLWLANRWLLEQAGIPSEQIEVSGHCTYTEHEQFFSARRLGIKSGRLLSGIMLR